MCSRPPFATFLVPARRIRLGIPPYRDRSAPGPLPEYLAASSSSARSPSTARFAPHLADAPAVPRTIHVDSPLAASFHKLAGAARFVSPPSDLFRQSGTPSMSSPLAMQSPESPLAHSAKSRNQTP